MDTSKDEQQTHVQEQHSRLDCTRLSDHTAPAHTGTQSSHLSAHMQHSSVMHWASGSRSPHATNACTSALSDALCGVCPPTAARLFNVCALATLWSLVTLRFTCFEKDS